ncbi:hypothetical protein [Helicobacter sp. T3_23-1056]
MKKSLFGVFIGAFVCVSLWQVMLIAKPTPTENEQSHHLQKQIHEIQHAFKSRIESLDTILKVILKAEQKNKSKTEYLTSSGYEHFYNKFKEKNENMSEISKWHDKNMQEIRQNTVDSAKSSGLASEINTFEANLNKISSPFLTRLQNAKTELKTKDAQKSVYKEKMEWILTEFDNEYAEVLAAAYSAFAEKILANTNDKQ